jgi:hypothetical protein
MCMLAIHALDGEAESKCHCLTNWNLYGNGIGLASIYLDLGF